MKFTIVLFIGLLAASIALMQSNANVATACFLGAFVMLIVLVVQAIKAQKRKRQMPAQPPKAQPQARPQVPQVITETIKVKGVSQYQDAIKGLMTPNDEYHRSDKDLRDEYTDERIYQMEFIGMCQLVPEPDNPYDKNAIRVEAEHVLIGYVPADKTAHVREILDSGKCANISLSIYGGKYKYIPSDEEDEITIDEDDLYWARIEFRIRK